MSATTRPEIIPISIIIAFLLIDASYADDQRFCPEIPENKSSCSIFEKLLSAIVAQPCASYKTCEDPTFGVMEWDNEETINQSTRWRSGYTQDAHCTDVINAALNARELEGQYKTEIVSKSEQGRWSGTFGRTRQYRYHCTIRIYYSPRFNRCEHPICGVK